MKSILIWTLAIIICSHTILYGQVTILNDGGAVLLRSMTGTGMHIDKDLYANVLISTGDLVFKYNNLVSGRLNESLNNTSFGVSSLSSNTSGKQNSAFGYQSMLSNTTGEFNTAVGSQSMLSNTIGAYNTAIGSGSLFNTTAGRDNTAIGASALLRNTDGGGNTGLGVLSLQSNTTGSGNTGVGNQALAGTVTGSNNTAIGYLANVSTGNLTNSTAIGYGAVVNNSNKIRLGNTSITSLECQVSLSVTSDARFKYNVQQNVPGLDFIQKLKPVTYQFDLQKIETFTETGIMPEGIDIQPGAPVHTGFLAQEVEKAATALGYAFDGVHHPENKRENYTMDYTKFVMPLVKAVQEQQLQIEKQQAEIEALRAENNRLVVQSKKIENMKAKRVEDMEASISEMRNELDKLVKLKTIGEQIGNNE